MECPNSKCGKRFYSIHEALSPGTACTEDFFKFVNLSATGRITKEELVAYYTTNTSIGEEEAINMIDANWKFWDVPKSHSFWALGFLRPKDQGDLDKDEFVSVQQFMAESLSLSLAQKAPLSLPEAPEVAPTEARGKKRPHPDSDALTAGVLRHVAQKTKSKSEDLQRKLRDNSDKGRAWFDNFDFDKSGKLEKGEVTTALVKTFLGSHQVKREQIVSIIDGIWDMIDSDGSGSIDFEEFQTIREALVAQMNHEIVSKAAASIVHGGP
jgi:Ca2+-binding EF-hand superfamily protein